MLEQTKHCIEDFKNAGFNRNEFSFRTKQDNQGGWKDTNIHFKNSLKKGKEIKDTKEKFENLIDNNTNYNYRVYEYHTDKGIRFLVSITNNNSRIKEV